MIERKGFPVCLRAGVEGEAHILEDPIDSMMKSFSVLENKRYLSNKNLFVHRVTRLRLDPIDLSWDLCVLVLATANIVETGSVECIATPSLSRAIRRQGSVNRLVSKEEITTDVHSGDQSFRQVNDTLRCSSWLCLYSPAPAAASNRDLVGCTVRNT
mmetsp:Transcript_19869/g.55379  ORF Transcript_19869/g.55379 Transcript_19869/m.55379 type:complete len:157 (+) Transcript_19869:426-896(+)